MTMYAAVQWVTPSGITVTRTTENVDPVAALAALERTLDHQRGLLISSRSEQPGRYRPYDVGYTDPPVEITARGREILLRALNDRGRVLLPTLSAALQTSPDDSDQTLIALPAADGLIPEEERTRRPSVFTVLRALVTALASPQDPLFGLYGAFGYDLILQFDPVPLHQERGPHERDLVLHLPDEIVHIDYLARTAIRHRYEFTVEERSTAGMPRVTPPAPYVSQDGPGLCRDHAPGEYAAAVEIARRHFSAGDMFEVVPGQSFSQRCPASPSQVFRRLRDANPSPYGLLANLGEGEYLVGASPEMFVRVGYDDDTGARWVESCPISGTIARGRDPLDDAEQIRRLLGSAKDESELTMCTDVDRNDKARVCEPGSVTVVGRRLIETYSSLIHTVDHVRGRLLPDRDALDAFATHMWAVTVTGAPKRAAVAFLERHERSPRRWYGGAVGRIGCDGTLDTLLTLRTIQIKDGIATVRAGATLLYDSDPKAEEAETELKALALLDALRPPSTSPVGHGARPQHPTGPVRVLMVDHEDSFVHLLAAYFREVGGQVVTYRHGFPAKLLDTQHPDLLVLSPGPGRPVDFGVADTLCQALRRGIPVFGVCLGLQGMVEHFGGTLGVLDVPVHGKPSQVHVIGDGGVLLAGLPPTFTVGRYHSLHARPETLPAELRVTARTDDGVIMAVEHRSLPVAAIQFHPESIMTLHGHHGHAIITNALGLSQRQHAADRHLAGTRH